MYFNEPCQQCSACKQIGLTDDTVVALVSVSPANHLSRSVWLLGDVGKAYYRLSLCVSQSIYSLLPPSLWNPGLLILEHHGKSLVIIFSAVSLPTHTLSLASSLLLLEKLWIMLVSRSLQGLWLRSTIRRAAALFIIPPKSFSPVNHGLNNYRSPKIHHIETNHLLPTSFAVVCVWHSEDHLLWNVLRFLLFPGTPAWMFWPFTSFSVVFICQSALEAAQAKYEAVWLKTGHLGTG